MFPRKIDYFLQIVLYWYIPILLCLGSNYAAAENKKLELGILVMGDPKILNSRIVSEPGIFEELDEVTVVSIPDLFGYCCAKITNSRPNESFFVRINGRTDQKLIEYSIDGLPQIIAGRLGVVIKGNKKIFEQETDKNVILVDIDADGIPETVKFCASSDGIHITVWTRLFENNSRIWHAYYYLNQDLEPNCSLEEMDSSL